MKKIDLHIHTKPTLSDLDFDFNINRLKEYIEKLSVDCIAITNHNLFDLEQFKIISESIIDTKFLPGIEINFEKGHLLLISENDELEDFDFKCKQVNDKIKHVDEYISVDDLKSIFTDLRKYLLIPHYGKCPNIKKELIEQLNPYITAGEVSSPKKFMYCIKNHADLVPVLFSDLRFSVSLDNFSPKQTYIDIDDVSLRSIKICLADKNKVFLSPKDGHKFFQALESSQVLSTGLNVILGERSSGKSYTLDKIFASFDNVKYIKQFELLERDERTDIENFNKLLTAQQSSVSEKYLKEFKTVVEDVAKIDKRKNERDIEEYLKSLLRVAEEEETKDVFSQTVLFNEQKFAESENENLKKLISAVELLINNTEYRAIINSIISRKKLLELIIALINKFFEVQEINLKKRWANSIISNIKTELQSSSASTPIKEINFYQIKMEYEKLSKFELIANSIKRERVIEQKQVRRFKIIASTKKFKGASELLKKSGRKMVFSDAFAYYENPIEYLNALKEIHSLPETDYYNYFIDIEYKILNEYNIEISGGERSEFRLLEKIQDALRYDMLLIDEPESSFDNLFLRNEVNEQLKEISKSLPVIIVTHNNTVGASINPDYIIYTKKDIIDKRPVFKVFAGYPSDKKLISIDGEEINNYGILLNCLEAGTTAYNERRRTYEILED